MNKEEILMRSQEENGGRDLADLEISKYSTLIGWLTVLCILAVVSVVDALVFERVNNEIFFAVMSGLAAVFIYKYRKLHQRHELFVSICYVVAALAFLTSWIIQLTGA